jgi:hypothetical protein
MITNQPHSIDETIVYGCLNKSHHTFLINFENQRYWTVIKHAFCLKHYSTTFGEMITNQSQIYLTTNGCIILK